MRAWFLRPSGRFTSRCSVSVLCLSVFSECRTEEFGEAATTLSRSVPIDLDSLHNWFMTLGGNHDSSSWQVKVWVTEEAAIFLFVSSWASVCRKGGDEH